MGKFEDQLLGDLMREHGPALATAQRPAPANRRPVWIAAGAVALAGAVTLGLAIVDGGSPAAFAVSQNADGSITVSIEDIAAIEPANKELERLGVPIRAVPARPDCQPVHEGSGGAAGGGVVDNSAVSSSGASAGGGGERIEKPNPQPPGKDNPQAEISADLGQNGGVTIKRSALTPGTSIALGVFTTPDGTVTSMSFASLLGPMPKCLPSGPPAPRN